MDYALLDWDNTLRKGYTLFSLIDFLVKREFIEEKINVEIFQLIESYKKNIISHDQLAEYACNIFSIYIKDKSVRNFEKQIEEYMRIDKKYFFKFTKDIFNTLNKNKILPIIISGAPEIVLKHYQKEFKIYKIYGFNAKIENEIFTGQVLNNFGLNKHLITKQIFEEIGKPPKLAFGDSISDYEMLRIADKSIIVCEYKSKTKFKADYFIEHETSSKLVIENIENLLL